MAERAGCCAAHAAGGGHVRRHAGAQLARRPGGGHRGTGRAHGSAAARAETNAIRARAAPPQPPPTCHAALTSVVEEVVASFPELSSSTDALVEPPSRIPRYMPTVLHDQPTVPPCRLPLINPQCTRLTRAGVPALSTWVRLVATARMPSSVTDGHSMRWSSVSAFSPNLHLTLRESLTMACRAALLGQAVHQHM